ncbi:hypothetical protein GV828_01835 [Flavobacterium sp. NST-5]|uniref:Addiction module protein n=1 Tax=Flavobacterium ichthyis TaxID=2698827 RepID=A0ABW9Z749_9FLAO|nr:hypothetical protein [Flavobacterium ichthyis]NBL63935.1 hypothetical protein [Flavobacterium ichthyis]
METKILRKKLIKDFGKILEDESKLELLESVFDAIIKEDATSSIPESHYFKIEEERAKYLSNDNSGTSWGDFEKELNKKYGF